MRGREISPDSRRVLCVSSPITLTVGQRLLVDGERCAEPWGHSLVAWRNRALSCGPAFVPCITPGDAASICSTLFISSISLLMVSFSSKIIFLISFGSFSMVPFSSLSIFGTIDLMFLAVSSNVWAS